MYATFCFFLNLKKVLFAQMNLTWIQKAALRNPEGAENMAPAPVCAALESSSFDGAKPARLPQGVGENPHRPAC